MFSDETSAVITVVAASSRMSTRRKLPKLESTAAVFKQLENAADNTDISVWTLQLEDRLQQVQQENTAVVKDVADMKVAMMRLQTQRLKSGSKAGLEVDMALAKVGHAAEQRLLRFGDGKSEV